MRLPLTGDAPLAAAPLVAAVSVIAAALLLAACGYPPTAPVPVAAEASLVPGRDLFVATCARCHGYPAVDAVSAAAWPETVKDMGEKSGLDAKQQEAVLHFVMSARTTH